MARSFSQEARSDSQKIGETRYRMSQLPSNTAIARVVLLAGILLAITLLASRSFFPAFAQETDKIDFAENSDDSVAVYTATDPEEEEIVWSLSPDASNSPDASFFSIDDGVLSFKSAPDFECPKLTDQGQCTAGADANLYKVSVVVKAGSGGDTTTTEQRVEVTVTNVEEPATLDLMTFQPKERVQINPTLMDGDGRTSDAEEKDLALDADWQWATSTSPTGPWNDIEPSEDQADGGFDGNDQTYTPRESDVGMYLRVTAVYVDGSGENNPFTDDVDESKDSVSMVTDNAVQAAAYVNSAPVFPDQKPDVERNQPDLTIEVNEDLQPGSNIGSPVVASDTGSDGRPETLRYSLSDVTPGTDSNYVTPFEIDSAKGQISLGEDVQLDFDYGEQQYVLNVVATDPSNVAGTAMVTIDILNVDENPKLGASDTSSEPGAGRTAKTLAEVDSTTSPATIQNYDRRISTYEATDDEDDRVSDLALKWSLRGGDANRFEFSDSVNTCQNGAATQTGSEVLLCLKAPLDYEASDLSGNKVYDVIVRVTDNDDDYVERDVDVTATNVEETGTLTLAHVQPEVSTTFSAKYTDPDGKLSVKSWQWATSTNSNGPWIDIDTRSARTANYAPRESDEGDFLRVTVEYTDGCGNETEECGDDMLRKPSALVVKEQQGQNNADPVFYDQNNAEITTVDWDILENTTELIVDAQAGDVSYFRARDADDDNLTLSLTRSGASKFTIVPDGSTAPIGVDETDDIVRQNGQFQLAVTGVLDYESGRTYSFSIEAEDPSGDKGTLSVTVNVKNVNEAPKFTSGDGSYSMAEHGPVRVSSFAASDPEGDTITWILSGPDKDDFTLGQNRVLSFNSSPDYEAPTDKASTQTDQQSEANDNEYVVVVEANDGTLTMPLVVRVTVTNEPEDGMIELSTLQPKITRDPAATITATLTDPDGRRGANLPLCKGETTCGGQDQTDLTQVTDASDAVTTWRWATSTSATGPWYEIAAATDSTYTLGENDAGLFLRATAAYSDGHGENDPNTRADEEEDTEFAVSARVLMADYVNKAPVFPDQNPDMPRDQSEATTRKVMENADQGDPVGDPVVAMDEGADGQQETLFYSLEDATSEGGLDDDEFFVIDSGTGQIRVKSDAMLNYENMDTAFTINDRAYEVTVTAMDPGDADGRLSDSITVTIEVLNVNEAPELADATASVNIAATTTPEIDPDEQTSANYNRLVSTYSATDHEDDLDADIRLEWSLAGPDSDKFEFSPNSLTACDTTDTSVRTRAGDSALVCFDSEFAPDYEHPTDANGDNVYNVTVVVIDSNRNTDSRDVVVTVTDEEEDGEVMLSNLVPEVGVDITAVLTDPDTGVRDKEWRWKSIDTNDVETVIEGATSATYSPVSGDTGKTLQAIVTYRDAAKKDDPFTATDESEITLPGDSKNPVKDADPNNKAPIFPDQDKDTPGDQSDRATRHVHENTKPGQNNPTDDENDPNQVANVGAPVTADPAVGESDAPDILTYTLGRPDAALFTVENDDPDTNENEGGQIRVRAGTELDFETEDTYTVDVIATDPSGASDTITVTIKVVDVDETPDVSKKGLAVSGDRNITVAEGSSGDLATYTASGADASGARWSLEGADAGDFNISSGILAFRSTPNYENPADSNSDNVYNVTVKAASGNISATRTVTVTVTNVNEDGSVSISPSGQPRVGTALTASVTDLDGSVTGITWQWASSSNGSTGWGDISGARSATYTPVEADVGDFLRATASYTDGHGSGKSENAVTSGAVQAASVTPPAGTPGSLALSPTTQLTSGDTVTAIAHRRGQPGQPGMAVG